MKITQEEVVEQQTVLHIELEDEDLEPYLDQGYRRVVNKAMVPGFRKGKAPRFIVERYMGRESLINEVIDPLLFESTQRAIETQELKSAGMPNVELLEMEPVTIKATVALMPEVELGTYRDIRVEEEPVEVNEEDVQNQLKQLLESSGTWEPAERAVQLGDMVTMDVAGTADGTSVMDQWDAVYVVREEEEESAMPFLGFAEHLEGIKVGEPKEFTLTISEDHADSEIAGKEAVFNVTVSEIKEQHLPELDDEFAKSLDNDYDSLEALREGTEQNLKEEAERAHEQQYREASLEELLKATTMELPPLLVEHEVERMASRRDAFVDRLNIRMDDYLRYTGKTEEAIREEMQESAVEQFTRSYALASLAESENLRVSDEEIDEKVGEIEASRDGETIHDNDHDLESVEVRSAISESLLVGKALDRLTAIARGEAGDEKVETADAEGDDTDSEDGGEDDSAKD